LAERPKTREEKLFALNSSVVGYASTKRTPLLLTPFEFDADLHGDRLAFGRIAQGDGFPEAIASMFGDVHYVEDVTCGTCGRVIALSDPPSMLTFRGVTFCTVDCAYVAAEAYIDRVQPNLSRFTEATSLTDGTDLTIEKPKKRKKNDLADNQNVGDVSVKARRPYGDLLLTAPNIGNAHASLDRAAKWLEALPEQLSLVGDIEEVLSSEVSALLRLADEWRRDGSGFELPAPFRVRLEDGTYETPVGADATYESTAALERRAFSSYLIAGASERQPSQTGLAVRHVEGEQVAIVELRPKVARKTMTDADLERVKDVASHLSPYDDDLLDLLISNIRKNGVDSSGRATIRLADIAEARDLVAYRDAAGKRQRDGIRKETLAEIYERLQGLEMLWVYTGNSLAGEDDAVEFDRVFAIRQTYVDRNDPTRVVGIGYEFGSARTWREAGVIAPTRLLQLDAGREGPAKKVGRYFFQRSLTATNGRIVAKVSDVLAGLRRPIDGENNPSRGRKWLEDALDTLAREKIIADWGYAKTSNRTLKLPRYGWWPAFLALDLYVDIRVEKSRGTPPTLARGSNDGLKVEPS